MARPLAIKGETIGGIMADLDNAMPAFDPSDGRHCRIGPGIGRFSDGRDQRIFGKEVEHIGQHQFLMLLLMGEAELDEHQSFAG